MSSSSMSVCCNGMWPRIGDPAPDFSGMAVHRGEMRRIRLADYANKYVVLFFYPKDFTFICPTEIIEFSERSEEFGKIECEIVGCSTDSENSHLAWTNSPRNEGGLGSINIPLLSDKTMNISRAYGVLKEDEGITFRGSFIIDGKGVLRQIMINDMTVGRSVDEALRLVAACQFVDTHGEVCPVNWKPGDAGMKPTQKGLIDHTRKKNDDDTKNNDKRTSGTSRRSPRK